MKKLLLVFVALICISCKKEGTYVPSENAKADFQIEFLFECDGVKMYRFRDGGRLRYYHRKWENDRFGSHPKEW